MAVSTIDPNGLNIGQIGGRRNLVINGAMTVAQRSSSVTGVTTGGFNSVDRFEFILSSLGTWTSEQSTDAPDGFANSHKLTATTADASPASGAYAAIFYRIEGQDLQSLNYGASGAKTAVISFWVKSNKTGNASFTVRQIDNSNETLPQQYTINSADTWEYKTITIVGDPSGNINNDNGEGMGLEWWMNSGSTYTGGSHSSTWITTDQSTRNASNLGVGGATSDYFAITGVQLELGDVATPFEHRSYGEELSACQRYYEEIDDSGTYRPNGIAFTTTSTNIPLQFSVQKRAAPTVTVVDVGQIYRGGAWRTPTGSSVIGSGTYGCTIDIRQTSFSTENGYFLRNYNFTFDAEL